MIDTTISYIKALFAGSSDGHDLDHSLRVYKNALAIASNYPEADMDRIAGNVVDLVIPPEYFDQTKKIETYVQKLEKLKPAYPVNIDYQIAEGEDADIDTGDLNLVTLFSNYLEQYDTNVDKQKIYDGFMDLYNTYKEQA